MGFLNQYQKDKKGRAIYLVAVLFVFCGLVLGSELVHMLAGIINEDPLHPEASANRNNALILQIIPFCTSLLAMLFAAKYILGRPILTIITTRKQIDWKRFFIAFGMWGSVLSISLLVDAFIFDAPIRWNMKWTTLFPLISISLILIPIQTTAEELFFRGILTQGVHSVVKQPIISVLLISLLFGALHLANPEIATLGYELLFYYIGTGVFLGVISHMDDGLELGMGYHAINNIFGALIITTNWQVFQTDALFIDESKPVLGWSIWFSLLIIHPIILFIFSKFFHWKNWKEKWLK